MVKYPRVNGFITVLGIAFIAVLGFVSLKISFEILLGTLGIFGLILVCFVINGIIGLYISKRESMVKHSKVFWFITVLGIIFVIILFVLIAGLLDMLWLLPYNLGVGFWLFCLFGGPVLLTIGILGIGRQYLKNNKSLFTLLALLAVVVIPLSIFAGVYYLWMSALTVGL